jgi:L-amino acid N-acyltransferase YncA
LAVRLFAVIGITPGRRASNVLIAAISADNAGSVRLFEKAGYEKCAYFKEVAESSASSLTVCGLSKDPVLIGT